MRTTIAQMAKAPSEIDEDDFNYFQNKLSTLAGIYLKESKIDLLKSRLSHRLMALSLVNYKDYRLYLESIDEEHEEWQLFINTLTTNKTSFFREMKHFDYLIKHILPHYDLNKKITIWSAPCSTGEECYSLAMSITHHFPQLQFEIIGSDIDTLVLEKAKNAVYPISSIEDIPSYLRTYIQEGKNNLSPWFRINPEIKNKVSFLKINLLNDKFDTLNEFDIIFCRNLLIYFQKNDIEKMTNKFTQVAKKQSFLFISHSENIQNLNHPWKMIAPSVYKR